MRVLITIWLILLLAVTAFSQRPVATKLYFFCFPSVEIIVADYPAMPIKIGRCTLVETTLDSLKLQLLKNKAVSIPLRTGQTYYFRRIIGSYTTVQATATLSSCSEEDFWLNGYFSGIGTYRHYKLDKETGIKLITEEK